MNKKTLFSILLVSVLVFSITNSVRAGCGATGGTMLDTIAGNVKHTASTVGSIIAVIGFIVAAILYLTSGGNPERITTAKRAVIAAVIGTALLGFVIGLLDLCP